MSAPTTDSAMYQTMRRQPAEVDRLLTGGWDQASAAADLLAGAGRVILTGIGTSYHAALVGSWLLRAAGFDAGAMLSFDLALYPEAHAFRPDDAVIVMAHTGVKRFSGEAMARAAAAGATVLSVGSQSAEHPGSRLILRTVERETSAAYTASHLAAMTVLAQVATLLGERRAVAATRDFRDALTRLPGQIAAALEREAEILPIAKAAVLQRVYMAGAGPNEATALEAVIKTREAAYGDVDALAIEQFLHGPIVTVNAGDLAGIVHVAGPAAARVAEICATLDAIGVALWIVGEPVAATPRAAVFALPELPELLSPLLTVVPMQMLAYLMAVEKGLNPDTFRRDNPVYKDAFGLLKL